MLIGTCGNLKDIVPACNHGSILKFNEEDFEASGLTIKLPGEMLDRSLVELGSCSGSGVVDNGSIDERRSEWDLSLSCHVDSEVGKDACSKEKSCMLFYCVAQGKHVRILPADKLIPSILTDSL